jgi:hypothetical protein
MRLHRIERHPSQKKVGEGADYKVEAAPAAGSQVGPSGVTLESDEWD